MEASTAQRQRNTGRTSAIALRTHLMDLELWGLLLIGASLVLFG